MHRAFAIDVLACSHGGGRPRLIATLHDPAVVVGSREMGDWQQREQYVALERQARDSTFLVIPVLLPQANPGLGFLGQNTWVDLRERPDDPAQFALLVAAIGGEPLDRDTSDTLNAT